jgi:hypothetical protein
LTNSWVLSTGIFSWAWAAPENAKTMLIARSAFFMGFSLEWSSFDDKPNATAALQINIPKHHLNAPPQIYNASGVIWNE